MPKYLTRSDDGSIISKDGRILFMSAERFARDICEGSCCFICGIPNGEAEFNDEHILPQWLLRRHDLHNASITLPNGQTQKYASYTIPCCKSCNSLLAKELEDPVSRAFAGGSEVLSNFIMNGGHHPLFIWMASIFLKIHLKDAKLRHHLNRQQGDASIAEESGYAWNLFHHLHCVVRSVYTGARISSAAYGSLATFAASAADGMPHFDLVDLSLAQTLALRVGEVAVFAIFDDACGCLNGLHSIIDRIKGPLNRVQFRELAAHFGCCNIHLENRPAFKTLVRDREEPLVLILGRHDLETKFSNRDKKLFGQFFSQAIGLTTPPMEGKEAQEVRGLIERAEISFLFDSSGKFIANGYRP